MFEKIINKLIEKNISISFAESCTGGALASTITKIPGVSKIFKGSFVTYSDEYKERFLNVSPSTIKTYGVVSKEVAFEMAEGLKKITGADIVISVTGNAGPTQGDINEPIGRIYLGFSIDDRLYTKELNLIGKRERIIEEIVRTVFNELESIC